MQGCNGPGNWVVSKATKKQDASIGIDFARCFDWYKFRISNKERHSKRCVEVSKHRKPACFERGVILE